VRHFKLHSRLNIHVEGHTFPYDFEKGTTLWSGCRSGVKQFNAFLLNRNVQLEQDHARDQNRIKELQQKNSILDGENLKLRRTERATDFWFYTTLGLLGTLLVTGSAAIFQHRKILRLDALHRQAEVDRVSLKLAFDAAQIEQARIQAEKKAYEQDIYTVTADKAQLALQLRESRERVEELTDHLRTAAAAGFEMEREIQSLKSNNTALAAQYDEAQADGGQITDLPLLGTNFLMMFDSEVRGDDDAKGKGFRVTAADYEISEVKGRPTIFIKALAPWHKTLADAARVASIDSKTGKVTLIKKYLLNQVIDNPAAISWLSDNGFAYKCPAHIAPRTWAAGEKVDFKQIQVM
jgi:hypothetical protein